MKKDIKEEIEIPEGIDVEINGKRIKISEGDKELVKELPLTVVKKEKKILIDIKKAGKREKTLIGTTKAHIKNMLAGIGEEYVYKLKICSVHFPMTVSVEDGQVIIKNFLGETKPRKSKLKIGRASCRARV